MKKFILIAVLLISSAFAQGVQWEKDFNTALHKAVKEKKPFMFLLSKHGCKWCTHLKQNTLSDPRVIKMLNENFVSYEGYSDVGGFPRELLTSGTPATWFISPDKTPMFQPIMGSMKADDYLKALNIVLEQLKKEK